MWKGCVGSLLAIVVTGSLLPAQEPESLTEAQENRLRERDRYVTEANRLTRAGKLPEATAAVEKALVIERELFGNRHDRVARMLEGFARFHEAAKNWAGEQKARQELVAI